MEKRKKVQKGIVRDASGGLGGHLMTASGTPTSDTALPNAILAVLAHIVPVTHLLRGQSCSLIADHQAVCRFRVTVAHSDQSQCRNSSKCKGEFAKHDTPPLAGQARMCASPSWPTNASCFYEPFHTSPNAQGSEKPQSTADSFNLFSM